MHWKTMVWNVARDRGEHAFSRYISLAVLSRNIQIIGHLLQQKQIKQERRKTWYRQTWANNRVNVGKAVIAA